MWCIMWNPKTSSMEYPFVIFPYVVPYFHMYLFKVFLYHLMGYIHLITMGSHKFKSFTRYITKWYQN
jgi:hypothetical protein